MTGWGRGFCGGGGAWGAGTGWPAGRGRGGASGWGRRWQNRAGAAGPAGWSRGWWRRGFAPPWGEPAGAEEDERRLLEREADSLESELARIRARLDELGDRDAK
jgi:hypothetical protein